jgi:predicted pyridoxine 5'-phosphate oxidase superfamily flavin-nucleotide-binding protein
MADNFLSLAITPAVVAAQKKSYGHAWPLTSVQSPDTLGADETQFIANRDSFYLSTINENGWPYIQHRGGTRGFLKVLGPRSLGFADLRGNRQLLTTGNLAANNRVSLFLMDYPRRERLKILGHARTFLPADEPELAALISPPSASTATLVERFFLIDVVAFDWNCPKYITPRYTAEEVTEATQPLRDRIAELEAALAKRPA